MPRRTEAWPPDRYPASFHDLVKEGFGVVEAGSTPWTNNSVRIRLYEFIRALQESKDHPLKDRARGRWAVRTLGSGDLLVFKATRSDDLLKRAIEAIEGRKT